MRLLFALQPCFSWSSALEIAVQVRLRCALPRHTHIGRGQHTLVLESYDRSYTLEIAVQVHFRCIGRQRTSARRFSPRNEIYRFGHADQVHK
jgi:hypothetical protein